MSNSVPGAAYQRVGPTGTTLTRFGFQTLHYQWSSGTSRRSRAPIAYARRHSAYGRNPGRDLDVASDSGPGVLRDDAEVRRAGTAVYGACRAGRRYYHRWSALQANRMSTAPQIGFTGCTLQASAASGHAPPAATAHGHGTETHARREVSFGGRRITTVDIHAHCVVPEALALTGGEAQPPTLEMDDTATRIAAMDAQGIDIAVLSINPFWYECDRDRAAEIIRIQNEGLVEICAREAPRFAAFATVALQYPELAVAQLTHAVRELGFRGVSVGGSVAGRELADTGLHPFWRRCEELGVLVFLHPMGTRELETSRRLDGSGMLRNTIGNPLETTIALSHLIFEGTLDRFPGLRICAAHGGGFLPSYAHRSDAVCRTFPARVGPLPEKPPSAYLRDGQLYFDTIVFTPEALRHLVAETGAAQVMMGTDYPFPWTATEVDLILSTPGLDDDQRAAMLGGTACALLGLDGR